MRILKLSYEDGKEKMSLRRTHPVCIESRRISLVYAARECGGRNTERYEEADRNRERERLKEQLMPYLREMVKKQLKEQQDYYKSRPSMAEKHFENIFRTSSMEKAMAAKVTTQVYVRMEERMRWEWLRRGR